MKTNLIRKVKWCIVGFIMVVIMLSVGLSFCSWDNLSINKALSTGETGNYAENPETPYVLGTNEGDDANGNGVADLGDIVTFGRYWQDAGATGAEGLKPQRWIIVNITDSVATLLAEKVVAYGNFWGNDANYQNYYQSTLRAWLNSGRDSVSADGTIGVVATKEGDENWRDDGIGSSFNGTAEVQANRGFLDVAFDTAERSKIIPKYISEIFGYTKNGLVRSRFTTRNGNKSINDLVWVPSFREIYGNVRYDTSIVSGDPNDTQFEYFRLDASSSLKVAEATDYAYMSSGISNFFNNGNGGNAFDSTGTWWWLRSPSPNLYRHSLYVRFSGLYNVTDTSYTNGGVRPAVCVRL